MSAEGCCKWAVHNNGFNFEAGKHADIQATTIQCNIVFHHTQEINLTDAQCMFCLLHSTSSSPSTTGWKFSASNPSLLWNHIFKRSLARSMLNCAYKKSKQNKPKYPTLYIILRINLATLGFFLLVFKLPLFRMTFAWATLKYWRKASHVISIYRKRH